MPVTKSPISALLVISPQAGQRRPPLEVVDVVLFGEQMRSAVADLDERFVEVVVTENGVGAEGFDVDDGLPPGRVVGCAAGPNLHADAGFGGHDVRTPSGCGSVSGDGPAGIGADVGAGDVAGGRGGEKGDDFGDFDGVGGAAQRGALPEGFDAVAPFRRARLLCVSGRGRPR